MKKATKPLILFLVGPTAVGKTSVALFLAKKIGAEIISCDSMQVYKGFTIVSSAPTLRQRKKIPYHLVNTIPPTKTYNASQYRKDALKKIKAIIKRGKIPLVVGGTGLYASILIDGIFKTSPPKKEIRQRLYDVLNREGNLAFYARLKKVDPEAAAKIHPNDTKRIIRALEVFLATGIPISRLQKQRKGITDTFEIKIFGLNMPRNTLYDRIHKRIDAMFREGLLREIKTLLRRKLSKTASYAIGIKEITGYLEGLYGLKNAKAMLKKNTRNYAKRQLTWFGKDKRIHWITIQNTDTPSRIATAIAEKVLLLQ